MIQKKILWNLQWGRNIKEKFGNDKNKNDRHLLECRWPVIFCLMGVKKIVQDGGEIFGNIFVPGAAVDGCACGIPAVV